jgi:cell division septation protein DedD
MRTNAQAIFASLLVSIAPFLTSCQPLEISPSDRPPITSDSNELDKSIVDTGEAEETTAGSEPEAAGSGGAVPTASALPTPTTPAEKPTVAEMPTPTSEPTQEPISVALPTPTTELPQEATRFEIVAPMASILVERLNVRSGPGVNYTIVLTAEKGNIYPVLGQSGDCSWIQIATQPDELAWISGSQEYVSVTQECAQIPAVAAPPTPVPPTSQPVTVAEAAPAQPTALPQPDQEAVEALPADQGCYLMENYIGAELSVTITAQDWDWNDNFIVDRMGEHVFCLSPGTYTLTIDAPPPWADINTELKAVAGERLRWPIWGEQQ